MDKAKICVTMPQKVLRCVKKQNILVYDKSINCPTATVPRNVNRYVPPRICAADVKKIRVCTGADMRRTIPPKLCDCPPKKDKGLLTSLFGFLTKGALVGGLIYWTCKAGLWGKSEATKKIYVDLCSVAFCPSRDQARFLLKCEASRRTGLKFNEITVSDEEIRERMKCCKDVPSIQSNVECFKKCWNRMVTFTFGFFAPSYASDEEAKVENVKNPK